MYLIHITGVRNPIEVTTIKGEEVKRILTSNPMSEQMVEVNDRTFRISAIKEVEYIADPRSDYNRETELPKTPEEREQIGKMLQKMREELEDRGVFKETFSNLHAHWRGAGFPIYTECRECGTKLPPHLREFCSGDCLRKSAKARGMLLP